MQVDPRKVVQSLGGSDVVASMNSEARAEALEGYLSHELDAAMAVKLGAPSKALTVAEMDEQIETRSFRRGVGSLYSVGAANTFGNRLPGG